jgi:hypothetical protein
LLSLVDDLPTVPFAASLVSFTRRRLGRRAARSIACSFHASTSYPPCRLLHRLLLSLVDVLPAKPLTESLVYFACRRLPRRATRCLARCFHLSMTCPPRHSVHCLFLSFVGGLRAGGRANTSTSECRRRTGERTLRRANAGDERASERFDEQTPEAGGRANALTSERRRRENGK